jgi:hypothetical protein
MLSGLFQAAAHLPPTVSHILLQALFTESLHGELPLPLSPVEGLACQLLFQAFFTESSHGEQLLALSLLLQWRGLPASLFCRLYLLKVHVESSSLSPPPFSSVPKCPTLLAVCLFQFLAYYSVFIYLFFCGAGVSLPRRLCWFIPGVAAGVLRAAYLFTCWSASPKHIWSWHLVTWEPSWFLSVMWHGKVLCRLGVQGVGILLILGGFCLPSVAPVSQQNF